MRLVPLGPSVVGVRVDFGVLIPSVAGETVRLGGRAVPGGRKRRRWHDKGCLPTSKVSPCFSAGG